MALNIGGPEICNRTYALRIFGHSERYRQMPGKLHFVTAALASILACSVAGAQVRGGAGAAPAPVAQTGPVTGARAARLAAVIRVSPNGHGTNGRGNRGFSPYANSVTFGSENGVPGLGFDYPHLAAISGGLHNNPPAGFRRGGHHAQGSVVPIFYGGYPYYPYLPYGIDSPGLDYDQPQQTVQPQAQAQPQIIVIEQPVAAIAAQPRRGAESYAPAASSASTPPPAPAPVRDVGDFILIRRDGRILFASAFSVAGAQLQYVTPEGIRHTLPLAELDAEATRQMNEACGSTVQLRN